MKRLLFLLLGTLTFTLGTIGIFLPILPTTVFYLVTAFLWLRSSEKLYLRFKKSHYYQKYIQEALVERNVSLRGKMKLFVSLFVVFLIPCLLVRNLYMTVSLAFIYLCHVVGLTWHFKRKATTVSTEKGNRSIDK